MEKQNVQSEQQNPHPKKKPNWAQIIQDWQRSGLSQETFCRNQGISYSTFVYWRVKALKSKGIQKPKETPSFIPIHLKQSHEKDLTGIKNPSIQLELPNGIRLSIPSTFERSVLATLFSLLGIRAC